MPSSVSTPAMESLLVMHAESFGVHVFQKRFHSFLRRIGVPLQTTPALFRSTTTDAPDNVFAAHA